MSQMTKKMAEAGSGQPEAKGNGHATGAPKKGDRFRCRTCGMGLEITADCRCQGPAMAHFHCCGAELQKV
jgi:hypothetical protein